MAQKSGFFWDAAPDPVFVDGMKIYLRLTMDALYALMVEEAPNVERYMRESVEWEDFSSVGKEYLRASPFRDDDALRVGIVAYYDEELYRQFNPNQDPNFSIGLYHERLIGTRGGGVISVILPHPGSSHTALLDEAVRIMDMVHGMYF